MQKPTPNFLCRRGRPKKGHGDNCLSYPPWRLFGSLIVLLFLRTNKPIRINLLSIFLKNFRGPRKMVFRLKIMRSISAVIMAHCGPSLQTSRVLFSFLKWRNYFFGTENGKEKHKSMFRWSQNGRSRCTEFSNLSGEEFFLPSTATKTWQSVRFQVSFEYRSRI